MGALDEAADDGFIRRAARRVQAALRMWRRPRERAREACSRVRGAGECHCEGWVRGGESVYHLPCTRSCRVMSGGVSVRDRSSWEEMSERERESCCGCTTEHVGLLPESF